MPEKARRADARTAAAKYAPRPDGSMLTYGAIAVSVLAMALVAVSGFYQIDMLSQPLLLGLAGIVAFIGGCAVRIWMKRRHTAAFEAEYARREEAPRKA